MVIIILIIPTTSIIAISIIIFYLLYGCRLEEILRDYGSGAMLTGEVKKELIAVLQEMVRDHQERRAAVTKEIVEQYMEVRQLEF